MKVLVEITVEVDDTANFLSSDPRYHLEDIKEELELALYEIDDMKITKIILEEL